MHWFQFLIYNDQNERRLRLILIWNVSILWMFSFTAFYNLIAAWMLGCLIVLLNIVFCVIQFKELEERIVIWSWKGFKHHPSLSSPKIDKLLGNVGVCHVGTERKKVSTKWWLFLFHALKLSLLATFRFAVGMPAFFIWAVCFTEIDS